jgi:hypothetical protein
LEAVKSDLGFKAVDLIINIEAHIVQLINKGGEEAKKFLELIIKSKIEKSIHSYE